MLASPKGGQSSRHSCQFAGQRFYGYTFGMKTAVSIPDDVFEGAQRLARRTKRSRSRVFSDALREYLARHSPDEITDAMNKACAEMGESSSPFAAEAARRTLERIEW
jgi:metal-responsive CopG/Arc/MetJ family transcriptional regulator